MRKTTILLAASLAGCSGPIVSEKFALGASDQAYHGTAHGLYCLPKEYFILTVKDAAKAAQGVEISVTQTTAPDLNEVYRLGVDESWFSDDKITVEYATVAESTESGAPQAPSCLLSKISSEVTDKSPEVVSKLTKTVLRAYTGKPDATLTAGNADEAKDAKIRFATVFEVSPDDKETLPAGQESAVEKQINDDLRNAGLSLRVELNAKGPSKDGKSLLKGQNTGGDVTWGVFGRLAQPYLISVYGPNLAPAGATNAAKQNRPLKRLITQELVYSHNGMKPYFVAIDRGAFIKRTTTIDFTDGYPVAINTVKGSELSGFMRIPLDIVTAIVSAPVDALDADKALATERAALITEQKNLLVKQRAALANGEEPADKKDPGKPGDPTGQ